MAEEMVEIGRVSRLTLFPFKSAKGIDLPEALCTTTGLKTKDGAFSDRHWIVTNTASSRFVTGRQNAKLTTIQPTLSGDELELNVDGMSTLRLPSSMQLETSKVQNVKVWGDDIHGMDCGDEAAEWISTFLGNENYRLLFCATGIEYRKLTAAPEQWQQPVKDSDQVAYHDAAPFLLLSEASLADVNGRLPQHVDKIRMEQFRPNIVVSGCQSFDEDKWVDFYIAGAKFTNIKLCDRCIMTTIDPEIGERHPEIEPLRTLRSYRLLVPAFGQAPCFGVNLIVDKPVIIKVGDRIMTRTL